MSHYFKHDVIVIGSGLAGISLALRVASFAKVALICKGKLADCATYYAQGGIAAVMASNDSLQSHIEDTLNAGAGLCKPEAVAFTVNGARSAIDWLVEQGVNFNTDTDENGANSFHLTQEGGHSHRRILHVADMTGQAIETTLIDQIKQHPSITCYEHHISIDLITEESRCVGVYTLNELEQRVDVLQAKVVVLATGGASKVYLYTTNPDVASGDGIAMAWRAGCQVANLEFNQFHPTALFHPQARSFLISEALRGEGATLHLPDQNKPNGIGERFMMHYDERAELAPRDIVARAIDHEMKRLGLDYVYLDISHKPAAFIKEHFPMIYNHCLEFNIDITQQPIPVVPAAHYTCGGVVTDLTGKTDIANLYAVGEVACTGLHGANRMASNSLLECLVFADAAASDIRKKLSSIPDAKQPKAWDETRITDSDEEVIITHNWHELRRSMWNYMGIVRTTKRLERALHRIHLLQEEITEYYRHFRVNKNLLELRNLVLVAELMVLSALARKESRGLHYTLDFPQRDDQHCLQDTILVPSC